MLICGIITNNSIAADAESALAALFGPITIRSKTLDFDFTSYYEQEMGLNLLRFWTGFEKTVQPERLYEFKLATNNLEQKFASHGKRKVNLDPGILSLHNLILATTKNYAHRIYLGHGIYAELTMIYHSGRYRPLEWTYPDYKTETCQEFLARCRKFLINH